MHQHTFQTHTSCDGGRKFDSAASFCDLNDSGGHKLGSELSMISWWEAGFLPAEFLRTGNRGGDTNNGSRKDDVCRNVEVLSEDDKISEYASTFSSSCSN